MFRANDTYRNSIDKRQGEGICTHLKLRKHTAGRNSELFKVGYDIGIPQNVQNETGSVDQGDCSPWAFNVIEDVFHYWSGDRDQVEAGDLRGQQMIGAQALRDGFIVWI